MTPKEQFLKSPHAKAFADIAASEAFSEALQHSMLQLIEHSHVMTFPKGDLDHRSYFAGVNALKGQLLSIAIPEEPDKPTAKPSLNHDAYEPPTRRLLVPTKPAKPTA